MNSFPVGHTEFVANEELSISMAPAPTYDLHRGKAVIRSFAAAYGISVIVSSG